jgi:hypothetical protein
MTSAAPVAFATFTLLASVAHAQAGAGGSLDIDALLRAPPGAWAEYTVRMKGQADVGKIRYTLVGRTAAAMVLEIASDTRSGPLRMRVDYARTGETWKAVQGHMFIRGVEVRVPPPNVYPMPPLRAAGEIGALVGREQVTTPAGRFSCRRYDTTAGEPGTRRGVGSRKVAVWMSDQVLPTGLVKARSPADGIDVVLTAMGAASASASAAGGGRGR